MSEPKAATTVGPMEVRPATASDCRRVWEIATAPEVRRWSFSAAPISRDEHETWFRSVLRSSDRCLLVAVVDGRVVGYVRLDRDGGRTVLSIAIDPERHGGGVGRQLLATAISEYARGPLRAQVMLGNTASLRLFGSWRVIHRGEDHLTLELDSDDQACVTP